jgi:lysosomal acid lipase/cholesteryl ester hydrolase
LGNVRGNTYSRNHTHLQVLDPRFWAFSWDDMALKDLPAMLVAELALTGVNTLGYVGHSQGTTVAMALLSSGQDVVQHINVSHAAGMQRSGGGGSRVASAVNELTWMMLHCCTDSCW